MAQSLWKAEWGILKTLKTELCCDQAIPFLGIYQEKKSIRKYTCTPVFTIALFTTAKIEKQPKCLSTDEWTKREYTHTHTHTRILLSHKK